MDKLKVLIVDDEPPAREGLRLLLGRDPAIEIVGECRDGRDAIVQLTRLQPDLVFLDVQMPELDGFAVLEQAGVAELPLIIFVTAYDRYALRAFEVQALDYLLKPFTDERFFKALERAKAQLARGEVRPFRRRLNGLPKQSESDWPAGPSPYPERLMIKSGGRVLFLAVDEIDWIEAADYYVVLHVGAKTHLLRETIARLEARLDAARFLRIHRSTIVNLAQVRDWHPREAGEFAVILRDGTQLQCSRRRRKALEQAMQTGSFSPGAPGACVESTA
jgi:two-component system, LytTR family, response regulator